MSNIVVQQLFSLLKLVPDERSFKAGDALLEGISSTAKKVAGAFGGVFAADAIIGGVNEVLRVVPRFKDMADAIGVSTEEIQRLGFVASQSGSDTATLEAGLIKFVAKVGEAKRGSTEMAAVFAQLGIPLASLNKESIRSGDAFRLVADGIAKVQDPAKRASFAMKLFEEGGLRLVPMLSQGGAAIKQIGADFDVIDDASARAIGAVADRVTAMTLRLENAKAQMVLRFLPVIDAVVEVMTRFAKVMQRLPGYLAKFRTAAGFTAKVIGVILVGAGLKWLATLAAFVAGNFIVIANNSLLTSSFGVMAGVIDIAAASLLSLMKRFIIMAAPMVAVAAIGALVVLTIDEIVTGLSGGRTVFDDVIGKFGDIGESLWHVADGSTGAGTMMRILAGLGAVVASVFDTVDGEIRKFFDTLITLGEFWDDLMLDPINAVVDAIRGLVSTIRAEVSSVLSFASRALDALPGGVQLLASAATAGGFTSDNLASAASFVAPSTVGSIRGGAGGVTVGAPSIEQNITINGNADARTVADIGRATSDASEAALRAASLDLLPGAGG